MSSNPNILGIRAKKIGLMIVDVRKAADKEIIDCAKALGITSKRFKAYESGALCPSLPELEVLAFVCNIPLEHFWNPDNLLSQRSKDEQEKIEQFIRVRQRVIAAQLRVTRDSNKISLKSISQKTGIPSSRIGKYERGEIPIPVAELESIASALSIQMPDLLVRHGKVGKWRAEKDLVEQFQDLPIEMQQFICKPVNLPYLELAMKLSDTSVDKLRAIAENILNITY